MNSNQSLPVKVVTDSTSDIPAYAAAELGIAVVPLAVKFGEESFLDGLDIGVSDFYDRLSGSRKLPTTAAPSPGQFLAEYEKAAREGRDVLSIHISRKLSGTYDAALLAKEQCKARVEVIDSGSVTMGLGLMVVVAAKKAREGVPLERLLREVQEIHGRVRILGVVNTLEYLWKGGRIGLVHALMGSVLSIKPILSIRDGETFALERVRTRSRALARLWKICQADAPYDELSILYSTTPDEAESLLNKFASIYPRERTYKARFGPVLGSHLGPGVVGVAYIKSK